MPKNFESTLTSHDKLILWINKRKVFVNKDAITEFEGDVHFTSLSYLLNEYMRAGYLEKLKSGRTVTWIVKKQIPIGVFNFKTTNMYEHLIGRTD